jgi:hypothetical protein
MPGKKLELQITSGNASWIMGKDADKYWTPYLHSKHYPLEIGNEAQVSSPGFNTDTVYLPDFAVKKKYVNVPRKIPTLAFFFKNEPIHIHIKESTCAYL